MRSKERETMRRVKWGAVTILPCVVIVVLALASMESSRGNMEIETELKALMMENLVTTQEEDLVAVMKTMHTMSPAYSSTMEILISLTETYDLNYELLSFSFIGLTDEYALVRAEQSTTKVSGPAFQDNVIDTIQIFRKEDGQWRIWTTAILEITTIN